MKTRIALFFATAFVVATLVFGSQHLSGRLFETTTSASSSSSIASEILYDSLFRMDISFRRKALEQELSGKSVASLKYYFKNQTSLSDEQDLLLEQVAIEYVQEVEPIDAQARQIIAQFREQFPDHN